MEKLGHTQITVSSKLDQDEQSPEFQQQFEALRNQAPAVV